MTLFGQMSSGSIVTTGAGTITSAGNISAPTLTLTGISSITPTTILCLDGSGVVGKVTLVPVASGGTGVSTSTGTINTVLSNSPTFTGVPLATTAAPGTNTTQIATTAFVTAAVSGAGVSSFSGGSTGLLPNTATTGAIVLTGAVTNISPTPISTNTFIYPVFVSTVAGGSSTTYVETGGYINYNPSTNLLALQNIDVSSILYARKINGNGLVGIDYDTTNGYPHTFKVSSISILEITGTGLRTDNISGLTTALSIADPLLKFGGVTKCQILSTGCAVDRLVSLSGGGIDYDTNSVNSHTFIVNTITKCYIGTLGLLVDNILALGVGVLYINGSGNGYISLQSTGTTIAQVGPTGFTISKSATSHATLTDYELVVGDNSATANKSAKILVRGNSTSAGVLSPSIDFTAAPASTTPDASISVISSSGYAAMYFKAKPTLTPVFGLMTTMMRIDGDTGLYMEAGTINTPSMTVRGTGRIDWTTGSGQFGSLSTYSFYINAVLYFTLGLNSGAPRITFNGTGQFDTVGGYNWFIGGTQVGYFDGGASNWRISAIKTLNLQAIEDIELKIPASMIINIVVPLTSATNWGNTGWRSGATVFSPVAVSNQGAGLGIAYNSTLNSGEFATVNPGVSWQGCEFWTSTTAWYHNGAFASALTGTGWVNVSDARCKKDIKPLSTKKSLQRILQCRTTYYHRTIEEETKDGTIPISQEDVDRVHIGLIAQEVNDFNPHCVSEWETRDKEKRFGIQYNDFVIHLIGAVQEQHAIITAQQAKIEEQSTAINTLNDSVKTLTEHLTQLTNLVNELSKKK
jgi:hypothetical protein